MGENVFIELKPLPQEIGLKSCKIDESSTKLTPSLQGKNLE
jgi:hypothetical protein